MTGSEWARDFWRGIVLLLVLVFLSGAGCVLGIQACQGRLGHPSIIWRSP